MITIKRWKENLREDDIMISIVTLHEMFEKCDKAADRRALETAIKVLESVWDTYFGEDEVKM